ncbi:unnamed protein product [Brassicogethes aeneus]|uniref:Uncharacterized protein n=1 Tax=Brassicogethes aeneus TaxID=1431903 RepID=A0A9P0BHE9_BRAAE|nr:unnamed protein product [Brassicogethes aeneus]
MQAPLIPLYKINQLRCFNCNQFLLCGPIHLNPNDGSSLCGRCRGIATNIFHNKAYEAIASIFGHPCVNWEKHCDQILLWNGNFAHENECTQPGCCICCKSSRKLPSDNGNALPVAKVPIEALEKLKCIFCYGFISCGPVLLTPDGENICNRCVATQENLYNEKRNLPYEMLAEILIFPCRYIRRGCPSSFKYGVDIFEHENHCDYRQVNRRQEPEREFSQRKQGVIKYSKLNDKKERGVIQTHAGHVFGNINNSIHLQL